jgi:hypothetical protein
LPELDEQEFGENVPSPQLQSIAGALSDLKGKELVEKCIINREDY